MAKSLLNLFKKKMSFKWKKEQQKAFKDLKENMLFTLVLKVLDFIKLVKVHIDVSDFTIGGVMA
jgi:hypothetical protein